MRNFLTGHAYREAIKEQIQKSDTIQAAVAFWGKESDYLLNQKDPSKIQIICDVSMGASNAAVIKAIQSGIGTARVKKVSSFHAKVWIFDNALILGSANASTAALGPIGEETGVNQLKHIEYGVLIQDPTAVAEAKVWFNQLFNDPAISSEISKFDLEILGEKNKARSEYKSFVFSKKFILFLEELRSGETIPFISWWDEDDEIPSMEADDLDGSDSSAGKWIESAAWIGDFDERDVRSYLKDRSFWVLNFVAKSNGTAIESISKQTQYGCVNFVERILIDSVKTKKKTEVYLAGSNAEEGYYFTIPERDFWVAFATSLANNPHVMELIDIGPASSAAKNRKWKNEGFLSRQIRARDLLAEFWVQVMEVYDRPK